MHEKRHFLLYWKHCHDAKIMCIYHYMHTTSLWGVAAKWPARAPKMSWYLAESVWACQAGFWKSTRTSCQQQNWKYGLVSRPFSSPQVIMYWSAFCIVMGWLKCLVWLMFCCFFTLPLDQTWLINDRTSVKLNFKFFCVPRYKLLLILYITSKVVSNVTKSSASDDLLHVNCNAANRIQTCFQSAQVVDCFPSVWVLVLYWRPFYFFVIVESLLYIFISLSFVLFQVFCSLHWCFLHRRKCCWLQTLHWCAVFSKVWKTLSAKCSPHKWAWWGTASKSAHLILLELVHRYVLGCLWIVAVCCTTVGQHG